MGRPWSGWLAMAGLALMASWLIADPPAGARAPAAIRLTIGLLCALPLLVLLATGRRSRPRWGLWTALLMIPYVALSVGAMLVTPSATVTGALFAALAVMVFFAGLDAARRPVPISNPENPGRKGP